MPFRRAGDAGSQAGVTLIEVVVALALTVTTMAVLAPLLATCTSLIVESRAETRATMLACARLDELCALTYEQDASSLAFVTDDRTDLSTVPFSPTGRGLTPGEPSAAWTPTPGAEDRADREGRTLTPAEASRATYVRRWAVSALPAPPGASRVLLQVFAREAGRERREAARTSAARRPGDVWLFTVRTRVLR